MNEPYVDALATLSAISGAAFAQSSVTLSGRINVGMTSVKTTDANGNSVTARDLTGGERTRTGSRLTFAGVEDLGGGLKAGFDYTANLYTGIGDTMKTRRANVSLSGGFGTVAMGSFDSNALDAVRGFSATTVGLPGGDVHVNASGSELSGATSNAVVYVLPTFAQGLKTSVAFVNQSRVADAATGVTADQKAAGFLLGAEYATGPLTVKFGHGNAKLTQVVTFEANTPDEIPAGNFDKVTDTAIGASYNLGMAVPYAIFEADKYTTQAGGAGMKNTTFELGSKFPMGALTPYISIGSSKAKNNGVSGDKTTTFQLGTTYDLSKRTYFYAAMGQAKAKSSAGVTGAKKTGFGAGMVHMF